ncbi:torsin-2A [Eurytemora carolleeae]|uniref:torsin-2A n=1 Tax=Eurytemora carolleeae TaxID=1294199 RepID=UPI000C75F220|nr:torsin-2A [Eurytemora carolleeae]|eukprot:XP_023337373.1 torsin-2A-like [Eurytemora affinis]
MVKPFPLLRFPSAESRLEDTISRDSGNSSGGTPEAGRRGTIIRHNSYPSPFMNSSAVQTFTEDHCDRKPYDTVSLTTGGPKYNDDSLSVRSLDSNSKTWSPLSEEMRPHLLRRNCASSEARSLEPTKPELNSTESNYKIEKIGLVGRVLRRILKLFFLLLLLSVIFFSFILILEIVKSYKCMSQGRLLIDTDELSVKLKQNLFGQHIAQQEIVSAIDSFINESSDSGGKPLLVLILTGWLGSGKTFTTSLISSVFPVPGNIHSIIGTYLSSSSLTDLHKIISRSCGYNLLILDDVDSGEEVGLRKLETLLVSLASEVEAQNNGTLVLLTTNIGGHSINRYMLEKVKEGFSSLDTVEGDSIRKHLQEDKVSLPLQAFLSEYNIPVHVIPFLPLTRDQVRSCIHAELRRNHMTMSKDDINKVLDQVQFFNKELPIFAKTGCKKIMSKVNIALNGHLDL